jgi:hypothetical protein
MDAESDPNADTERHAHTDTYAYAVRDADRDTNRHLHTESNRHANRDSNTYRDFYRHTDSNEHAYPDPDARYHATRRQSCGVHGADWCDDPRDDQRGNQGGLD